MLSAAQFQPAFSGRRKAITLVLCLSACASASLSASATSPQATPLIVAVSLMIAGAALPWEFGWQMALVTGLLAIAADTMMARPASSLDTIVWIAMVACSAISVAGKWRRPQPPREANPETERESQPRMKKLFGADLSQASVVQLRGARFLYVSEDLVSNLSHQLRTALNAILGMAELLLESPLNPEQRRCADTMTEGGATLLDMINVMMDLARLESGGLRLEEKDFDLDQVMGQVADAVRMMAHDKGLELAIRISPQVPVKLIGDPFRLRQILIQLLDNAIKFTRHGEVLLTVETDQRTGQDSSLRFSVRDTGIGIAADQLETIFRTFTRGSSSTDREYIGSGIGLAIARRLADLMNGQITVESSQGAGSTFHFKARFRARPALAEPSNARLNGLQVLVVGSNDTNRAILREILCNHGATVVEADGEDYALGELEGAWTDGRPYHLTVLDWGLSAADALQVARRIRSGARAVEPMILTISSDDLIKIDRLREEHIDAYLAKPFKRADLMRAVATATHKSVEIGAAPVSPPEPEVLSLERPMRILLADDSPHNRLLIELYLKAQPVKIDMAENGEVALDWFRRGPYDLVLMDLRMPVMDGLTAVRTMRNWERESDRKPTPIVALSASALEADVSESIEAGCTAHLSKPVKKSQLLALLREISTAGAVSRRGGRADANGDQPQAAANGHRK